MDLSAPGDEELAKLEESGVRGRYVSVERVMELPDGSLEWRMAVSSTAGGKIPTFLTENSLPGKISHVFFFAFISLLARFELILQL